MRSQFKPLSISLFFMGSLACSATYATGKINPALLPSPATTFSGSYFKTQPIHSLTPPSLQSPNAAVEKEKLEISSIKSFHDWKNEKIQAVSIQILQTQLEAKKLKADPNSKPSQLLANKKQSDQLNWNMQVAQELSVTDYCVLYLSQQTQAKRFEIAASKLSTEEVAELMRAYAESLDSSPSVDSEPVAANNTSLSRQTRAEQEK